MNVELLSACGHTMESFAMLPDTATVKLELPAGRLREMIAESAKISAQPSNDNAENSWITVREAAAILGRTNETVYSYCYDEILESKTVKVGYGTRRWVSRKSVMKFLDASKKMIPGAATAKPKKVA